MVTYANHKQLNKRELYTSLNQPQYIVLLEIRKKAIVQAEIVFLIFRTSST